MNKALLLNGGKVPPSQYHLQWSIHPKNSQTYEYPIDLFYRINDDQQIEVTDDWGINWYDESWYTLHYTDVQCKQVIDSVTTTYTTLTANDIKSWTADDVISQVISPRAGSMWDTVEVDFQSFTTYDFRFGGDFYPKFPLRNFRRIYITSTQYLYGDVSIDTTDTSIDLPEFYVNIKRIE